MQFAYIIITGPELHRMEYRGFGVASNWLLPVKQTDNARNLLVGSFPNFNVQDFINFPKNSRYLKLLNAERSGRSVNGDKKYSINA